LSGLSRRQIASNAVARNRVTAIALSALTKVIGKKVAVGMGKAERARAKIGKAVRGVVRVKRKSLPCPWR
jgi:hypothetical protein